MCTTTCNTTFKFAQCFMHASIIIYIYRVQFLIIPPILGSKTPRVIRDAGLKAHRCHLPKNNKSDLVSFTCMHATLEIIISTTDFFCQGSERLQVLFEQWATCAGQWKESAFFLRLSNSTRFKSKGARRWLTFTEIAQRYGSNEVATSITEAKENAEDQIKKTQIRKHPDCAEACMHAYMVH